MGHGTVAALVGVMQYGLLASRSLASSHLPKSLAIVQKSAARAAFVRGYSVKPQSMHDVAVRERHIERLSQTYALLDVLVDSGRGCPVVFPFSYHVFDAINHEKSQPPVAILPYISGSAMDVDSALIHHLLSKNHPVVLLNYPTVALPKGTVTAADRTFWRTCNFDVVVNCMARALKHIYFTHHLGAGVSGGRSATPTYHLIGNSIGGWVSQRLLIHSHCSRTSIFEAEKHKTVLLQRTPSFAYLLNSNAMVRMNIPSILQFGTALGYPVVGGFISPKFTELTTKAPKESTLLETKVKRRIASLNVLEETLGDMKGLLRYFDGTSLEVPMLKLRQMFSRHVADSGGFPLSSDADYLKKHVTACVHYDPDLYGAKVVMESLQPTLGSEPRAALHAHAAAFAVATVGHSTRVDILLAKGGDVIFSEPLPPENHADALLTDDRSKRILSFLLNLHLYKRLPHYMNNQVSPLIVKVFEDAKRSIASLPNDIDVSPYTFAYS